MRHDASVDAIAYRVLKERTCLDKIFLKQFQVFGEVKRYGLSQIRERLQHVVLPELWYERAVSIGYYAWVDYAKVLPLPDLLPRQFTMPELQQLYEAILGRSLDSRNFYKKMLGLGMLRRLGEWRKGGGA